MALSAMAGELGQLAAMFDDKLSALKLMVDLKGVRDDEIRDQMMHDFGSTVLSMGELVRSMQGEVQKGCHAMSAMESIKRRVSTQLDICRFMRQNLPDRLPGSQQYVCQEESAGSYRDSDSGHCTTKANPSPMPLKSVNVKAPPTSEGEGHQRAKKVRPVPSLSYVTKAQYDRVPSYCRGRIPYDDVNKIIDTLNDVVQEKYKIMRKPRSQQSVLIRKAIEDFKQQETADTVGCYFITDEDIKNFSSVKITKRLGSILTIIRTTGRLKEVRGGSLTRYVIVV